MKKHKLLGWFVSVFPAILCLALLTPQPLRAQTCGQRINSDTVLTADIGPCPGQGLVLDGHDYTVDLNGHTISGAPGSGIGLWIVTPDSPTNITIKGPGVITSFGAGVEIFPHGNSGIIIHDLELTNNTYGVFMSGCSKVRIFRNEISTESGIRGVYVDFVENSFLYQNRIAGYALGMYVAHVFQVSIDENEVKGGGTGIYVLSDSTANLSVHGNHVVHNSGDAIYYEAGTQFADVQDNTIQKNGGNGIVLTGHQGGIIQNNIVQGNALSGISVAFSTGAVQMEVAGNFLQGNGTDLTWDGQGAANCWTQNVFDTSSPSPLPACQ